MILKEQYQIKETAVTIICDESYLESVKNSIFEAREIIEKKIHEDPFFKNTFEPYSSKKDDDFLIKRMCDASLLANVGPMASVAGAIGEYCVKKVISEGCEHIVFDNGGDIALYSNKTVNVGLFSENNHFKDLILKVPGSKEILGICSSSGKIGPSISFGNSSICTVISKNVTLADACATSLGNLITNSEKNTLSESIEKIYSVDEIDGCICIADKNIAMIGDVPELVSGKVEEVLISQIKY